MPLEDSGESLERSIHWADVAQGQKHAGSGVQVSAGHRGSEAHVGSR